MLGDSRLPERFWNKVVLNPETECWEWQASRNGNGYGTFRVGASSRAAHRFAYEVLIGHVPDSLELDHFRCQVRHCVNPAHLEAVTHLENVQRGRAGQHLKTRTHCPQGHAYSPANTRVKNGARSCRECGRIYSRSHKRPKTETPKQRSQRQTRQQANYRLLVSSETPEERECRLAKKRESQRRYRARKAQESMSV